MVCSRCKMVVQSIFEEAGLQPASVQLGEVELKEEPLPGTVLSLEKNLNKLGFELIDDKRHQLTEQIKNMIVTLVHHEAEQSNIKLSEYLSNKLHYDYNYLSNIFSEAEGTTIEKYFIAQRIEKIKELLRYDQLSLSEIADQLGYSSVAYLSNQFKKQTGLTPSYYKSLGENIRRNIEDL